MSEYKKRPDTMGRFFNVCPLYGLFHTVGRLFCCYDVGKKFVTTNKNGAEHKVAKDTIAEKWNGHSITCHKTVDSVWVHGAE